MRTLPFIYLLTQLVLSVSCIQNITIDDTSPLIHYIGQWSNSTSSSLDYGGAHAYTTNTSSEAIFNFTGVAIYFMSPLWPYAVSTALTIDSRPTVIVDLTDHHSPLTTGGGPESVKSAVVWSAENLSNSNHTLHISVGRDQQNAIVDGLVYTQLAPGESLNSGSSNDGHRVIIIVLAVLVGVLALLLLLLLLWLCLRRRDTASSSRRRVSNDSHKWGDGAGVDGSVGQRDHDIGSSRSPPPTAPNTLPPPSRPDSSYQPQRESVWSTGSVGGPGVPNMTGVGASTRNSHAISYHNGVSQGDLADAYHDGTQLSHTNRNTQYPLV
ncbi:hypothetical protein NP233_g4264 [Leucocoprinus birnbaumii]|uniref:Transmembrane protein n=1 Tax=Leucocoprinus birnbaumii TaxID=56174 RepID=A0AAD5YXQ7_9AGAR|nr:hypothetical protein NP233_g4264 [Leucocoprinus birnbaumii]